MFIIMFFLFFLTAYFLATIEEWFIHKYLMHTNIIPELHNNHMTHHKKTKQDLSSDRDEYICVDVSSIRDVIQIITLTSINSGFLYIIFSPYISTLTIVITSASLLGINILVWNTYHPYIHKMDGSKICNYPKGLSYKYLQNTSNVYTDWVVNNHKIHHKYSAFNFNIVYPGADYLFGTNKSKN